MTDWTVSRKLDEVIEQNAQIILLLQMQLVSDTPNINLHNLEKVTLKAVKDNESTKNQIKHENSKRARQAIQERENKEFAEREKADKLKREQKLKEKNDEIQRIISANNPNKFTGCGNSSDVMWMPSYGEND